MIEELPNVPPALSLIVQEIASQDSWTNMRRRLKEMLPDLRDQSEAYLIHAQEESDDAKSTHFDIHLHGALNLLAGQGCSELPCRVDAADRIARSVGLLADRVWLTDLFTDKFIDFGRPTNAKLDQVMADVIVLSRLLPLIAAGIVKFRSPWIAICSSCEEHFNLEVAEASRKLAKTFSSEFTIKKVPNGEYTADTGECMVPSLVYHGQRQKGVKPPTKKQFSYEWIEEQLHSIFWISREAAITGGAVFSNSRLALAGLLQQEGRLHDSSTLHLLDNQREINVPWVSKLDAHQILELRQEASLALPRFREKMFQVMSTHEGNAPNENSSHELIMELREQAEEVRAELKSSQKNSAKFWKTTYGVLGLGLSAYGVATDQVIAGVGGLLPILQLLIQHKTGHESKRDLEISKPGYVLLKAQDILSHAHD